MLTIYFRLFCFVLPFSLCSITKNVLAQEDAIDKKVDSVMAKMTLAEKVGQLNQYNGDWEATGPVTKDVGNKLDEIRQGRVGSVLNIVGTDHIKAFQDA